MKIKLLSLVIICVCASDLTYAQLDLRPSKSLGILSGIFGSYPSRVRLAPYISIGSASSKYVSPSTILIDTSAFYDQKRNPDYHYWFNQSMKNKTYFALGLMGSVPFSRHVVFRPTLTYSSKSARSNWGFVDSLGKDSIHNATGFVSDNIDLIVNLNQLQGMFNFDVAFGSPLQKTRVFMGAGVGFGYNMSVKSSFEKKYIEDNLLTTNKIELISDTSNSQKLSIGGMPKRDYYTRIDFMGQAQIGVEMPNLVIGLNYNSTLGSILTDAKRGTYKPYYFGLYVGYVLGTKPDIFSY